MATPASGRGRWHEGVTGSDTGAGLADQPEFPRPGDSLGAVGRAEFAQDVADVLLDGIEGDDERECDGTSVPSPPRKIPPGMSTFE